MGILELHSQVPLSPVPLLSAPLASSACGCSLSSCLKSVLRTINCSASFPLPAASFVAASVVVVVVVVVAELTLVVEKSCLILGLSLKWTVRDVTLMVAAVTS